MYMYKPEYKNEKSNKDINLKGLIKENLILLGYASLPLFFFGITLLI
jgi:hypothetical protein